MTSCQAASKNPSSTLASIPDKVTNDFLGNLTWDLFWTGGYESLHRRTGWIWTDGSPWTGFTNWGKNQPDNWKFNEHYIESNFAYYPGVWNDVREDIKRVSVCQYDNLVLELTTSREADSNCDCSMTVEIKAQNGNCTTIVLDTDPVGFYDDFVLGAVDVFKGDQLGSCKDFKPVGPLSIVMTHSFGDGWMGTNLNIYVGGSRIYKCPMPSGQWVWKETPVQEFQCYEDIECDPGWKYLAHTNRCYQLISDKMSWRKALKSCQAASQNPSSTLASIPDKVTNIFIGKLQTKEHFWTGGYETGGDWGWTDGSPWTGFTNWGKDQPDNWKDNEHFLESNFAYYPGVWNDVHEDIKRVSVCQYDK